MTAFRAGTYLSGHLCLTSMYLPAGGGEPHETCRLKLKWSLGDVPANRRLIGGRQVDMLFGIPRVLLQITHALVHDLTRNI